MALVLEILLGLMVVASFFVAYMSAKTWQVYQVVLIVFVFLGSVVFFNMAALTLATHRAWRTAVNQRESELAAVTRQTQEIMGDGPVDANGQPPKGIRQLKQELQKLAMDRGGVLYDVALSGVKNGLVDLTLKSPEHGLVANAVLFAFDQAKAEAGGRYQGEFKVVAVGEGEKAPAVQLAPNLPLTEAQSQRLAASKGPWTLYTTMPIDDAAVFANLDDKTKGALLPPTSLSEYAGLDRKLRDYELFFHENYVQRSLLSDNISKVTINIDRTTADVKEATGEIAYRETEKTSLQADLEKFQYERTTIMAYRTTLEQVFAQVRDSLKTTFAKNKQFAAELTAAQWKAAEDINQRTGGAQASAALRVLPAAP
ncbi:MAG: hypothetical protein HY288_12555 [Planctomycetia bacterium]|nr:hypothetical protein [Planctomycetia bacterium]